MRMRKKKNLDSRLAACAAVMADQPQTLRGRWRAQFGNENPIHLEIGCGKGRFILEMAKRYPDINFIAVEREEGALVMATEQAMRDKLPNLRFLSFDAAALEQIFAPGEVERIYLNFSDPWPKARHWKRRLTSTVFLGRYEKILKEGGILEFKTDNRDLFEFSLDSVKEAGWKLAASTFDLHHDPALCEGNVMTEYEQKFSSRGQAICKLVAQNSRAC